MRTVGCATLTLQPLTGSWHRAVKLAHYRTLLHYAHTATSPSRFNGGSVKNPFPILYFAETPQVALFEAQAMVGSPLPDSVAVPNPAGSWAVITVRISLSQVADLTLSSQRRQIRTTIQELTGDWIGYRLRQPAVPATFPYTDVPTQRLGAALARRAGLEAIVTFSARDPRHKNLVVFPSNLQRGSAVTFENPITGRIDRIGP